MMLSLDTAYRSFGGEVEASSTPTICRLPDPRRHQLPAIAPMRGATYSLLLHHRDFQFTASYSDGTIVLSENGKFSSDDSALLEKLLRHLEIASRRKLVRQPRSNNSFW